MKLQPINKLFPTAQQWQGRRRRSLGQVDARFLQRSPGQTQVGRQHRTRKAFRELGDDAQSRQPGPRNEVGVGSLVSPSGFDSVAGSFWRKSVYSAGIALVGIKRKLVDHVATTSPPMALCRSEQPLWIRTDQSNRVDTKMGQGTDPARDPDPSNIEE